MKRYVDDGPPIPLPSREELLATALPHEIHCESLAPDGFGRLVARPIVVRFATAEAARAWRAQ